MPGGIASLNSTLGQAKDGGLNVSTAEHLDYLRPSIRELHQLEVTAQHSFIFGIMHQANGGILPMTAPSKSSTAPKRPKEATEEEAEEEEEGGGASSGEGRGGGSRGSGKHRRHRGRGGGRS